MLEFLNCSRISIGTYFRVFLQSVADSVSGTGLALTEMAINLPWGAANVLIGTGLELHTDLKWRWCYYIGLIFGALSLIGTLAFYFPPTRPQFDHEKTRWQEFKQIDFVGIFLYAGGLTTFLIGLTWAGSSGHAWRSASVIAPIVFGFAVFVTCFIYDFTLAKRPFFPFPVFRQVRDFTVLLGVVFVAGRSTSLVQPSKLFY